LRRPLSFILTPHYDGAFRALRRNRLLRRTEAHIVLNANHLPKTCRGGLITQLRAVSQHADWLPPCDIWCRLFSQIAFIGRRFGSTGSRRSTTTGCSYFSFHDFSPGLFLRRWLFGFLKSAVPAKRFLVVLTNTMRRCVHSWRPFRQCLMYLMPKGITRCRGGDTERLPNLFPILS
jgi:hypothetical protein